VTTATTFYGLAYPPKVPFHHTLTPRQLLCANTGRLSREPSKPSTCGSAQEENREGKGRKGWIVV